VARNWIAAATRMHQCRHQRCRLRGRPKRRPLPAWHPSRHLGALVHRAAGMQFPATRPCDRPARLVWPPCLPPAVPCI